MPEISIILPLYNGETFIKNAVSKIRLQTFQDWELLIVDDGSTDRGGVIAAQEAAKDSRIRVFHKPNGGISSARNYGLSKASGRYIAFADQDDELKKNGLRALYDGMSGGMDLAVGGKKSEVFSARGTLIKSRAFQYEDTILQGKKDIYDFIFQKKNDASAQHVWNCLYKKELIDRHGISFDERLAMGMEDVLFNICYAYRCRRIHKIPACTYLYKRRIGTSTSTKHNPHIVDEYAHRMDVISRLFGFPYESYEYQLYGKYALRELCSLFLRMKGTNRDSTLLAGLKDVYVSMAPDRIYFDKKNGKERVYSMIDRALRKERYQMLRLIKCCMDFFEDLNIRNILFMRQAGRFCRLRINKAQGKRNESD